MTMTTTRTHRMTALLFALTMTVVTQGTMLWSFDTVAQQAVLAQTSERQAPALAQADAPADRGV